MGILTVIPTEMIGTEILIEILTVILTVIQNVTPTETHLKKTLETREHPNPKKPEATTTTDLTTMILVKNPKRKNTLETTMKTTCPTTKNPGQNLKSARKNTNQNPKTRCLCHQSVLLRKRRKRRRKKRTNLEATTTIWSLEK